MTKRLGRIRRKVHSRHVDGTKWNCPEFFLGARRNCGGSMHPERQSSNRFMLEPAAGADG
jgi:hypothetical protein